MFREITGIQYRPDDGSGGDVDSEKKTGKLPKTVAKVVQEVTVDDIQFPEPPQEMSLVHGRERKIEPWGVNRVQEATASAAFETKAGQVMRVAVDYVETGETTLNLGADPSVTSGYFDCALFVDFGDTLGLIKGSRARLSSLETANQYAGYCIEKFSDRESLIELPAQDTSAKSEAARLKSLVADLKHTVRESEAKIEKMAESVKLGPLVEAYLNATLGQDYLDRKEAMRQFEEANRTAQTAVGEFAKYDKWKSEWIEIGWRKHEERKTFLGNDCPEELRLECMARLDSTMKQLGLPVAEEDMSKLFDPERGYRYNHGRLTSSDGYIRTTDLWSGAVTLPISRLERERFGDDSSIPDCELVGKKIKDPEIRWVIAMAKGWIYSGQYYNNQYYSEDPMRKRIAHMDIWDWMKKTERVTFGIHDGVGAYRIYSDDKLNQSIINFVSSIEDPAVLESGGMSAEQQLEMKLAIQSLRTAQEELPKAKKELIARDASAKLPEAIQEMLGGVPISKKVVKWLEGLQYSSDEGGRGIKQIKVIDSDMVVVLASSSKYNSLASGKGGGIAYTDSVLVYRYGKTQARDYNWRDQYDASRDKPAIKVNEIGDVTVSEDTSNSAGARRMAVGVELINLNGSRQEMFYFDS
jgi:phage shock protein A